MKEDILEQLVEDWLQAKGYFTRANLKFQPRKGSDGYVPSKHSVASDIDVIGIHPGKSGAERVYVVNCKSWQDGFEIGKIAKGLCETPNSKINGRPYWKLFRELVMPEWTRAFHETICTSTGSAAFTYVTAVTFTKDPDNVQKWQGNEKFGQALKENPIRLITLKVMLEEVFTKLGTTVESSQFSRTLQLLKAAGINLRLDRAKAPDTTLGV